ncbi:hypothetical protein CHUAL_011817 [Chamberlinius hualienensis]
MFSRWFLLVCLCFVGIFTSSYATIPKANSKTNIIILLLDDVGWDFGSFGEINRETPNIDRMAAEGISLMDFYASNPLCSPSRASLLTGRLPIRNGFYTDNAHARNAYTPQELVGGISDSEVLISELLAQAGYVNKIIGKWHLGMGRQQQYLPLNHGFHEYFGAADVHFGPYDDVTTPNVAVFRDSKMIGRYYEDYVITSDGVSNLTDIFLQDALNFLQARVQDKQPFFLWWTPDSNHGPTYSSAATRGTSRRGRYGDSIINVDNAIGEMMSYLENSGLINNTFVFLTSDNGPALVDKELAGSNAGFLCGKQTTFEGGMRVPAIAWWPGKIESGRVSHEVTRMTDLFPTILDLVGLPEPGNVTLDGYSILPLLFNNTSLNKPVYYYRGNELFAIRSGFYKAHFWTWTNFMWELNKGYNFCPGESIANVTTHDQTDHSAEPVLFDLGSDPHERFPISPNSALYQETITAIRAIKDAFIQNLVPGEPQLNWCDKAAMHWAPPGCEEINKCLPVPPSQPYKCVWDH